MASTSTEVSSSVSRAQVDRAAGTSIQVPFTPVKTAFENSQLVANMHLTDNVFNDKEHPAAPWKHTTLFKVPLPEWISELEQGNETSLTFELSVPEDELTEAYVVDPSEWVIELNTAKLYTDALPLIHKYITGDSTLRTRWYLMIAGVLGPLVDRPVTISINLTFYQKQLANLVLNVQSYFQWSSVRAAIQPAPMFTFPQTVALGSFPSGIRPRLMSDDSEADPFDPPLLDSFVVVE